MLEDFRLKVFIKVAELGSFTLAAKQLGVSQPAVSQNITTLESSLGVKLFERTKGDALLTSEGCVLLDYARQILYWYGVTENMFGSEGKITNSGLLRISADDISSSYLLPEALTVLYSTHRKLSFEIKDRSAYKPELQTVFDKEVPVPDVPGNHFGSPEDADVEISVSPSPKTMDFEGESRLIGVMDAAVVISSRNRHLIHVADEKLETKPFSTLAGVHISNNFAIWEEYKPLLTPDLVARTTLFSSGIETIKTMVENSDNLVGVLPYISVKKELASGDLLRIPILLPDFAFDVHFNPVPEFAGKELCNLLKDTLKDCLR